MIKSRTSLNRLVETSQTGLAARNDKQNELHLHFTLPDVTLLLHLASGLYHLYHSAKFRSVKLEKLLHAMFSLLIIVEECYVFLTWRRNQTRGIRCNISPRVKSLNRERRGDK